ncbi:MAG: hypothetical protein QM811_29570 [Pirellulales bacterium]
MATISSISFWISVALGHVDGERLGAAAGRFDGGHGLGQFGRVVRDAGDPLRWMRRT